MIYQDADGRIRGCGVGEDGCSHGKSEVVRLANSRGWRLVIDAEYHPFVKEWRGYFSLTEKEGKGVSVFRDSIIVPMYAKN